MKTKFIFPVLIIIMMLVAGGLVSASNSPEKPLCPTGIQMGEATINIPAAEMVGRIEQQIIRCAGMNVQVSGGTMLETPIVINAVVHHDYLILRAYLQESQSGPVDVTVWWRVD